MQIATVLMAMLAGGARANSLLSTLFCANRDETVVGLDVERVPGSDVVGMNAECELNGVRSYEYEAVKRINATGDKSQFDM